MQRQQRPARPRLTELNLAVPTDPENFYGTNPHRFYGNRWKYPVKMACGCTTYAYLIGQAERELLKQFPDFDVDEKPDYDFQLTLFCGNCGKQITETCSAWIICRWHGGANWIAQNATYNMNPNPPKQGAHPQLPAIMHS